MAQATWQLFAGLAKESTWGTGVTASTFYPVKAPKFTVKYDSIVDDNYRSNASQDQAFYQGNGRTEIDTGEMNFYPDDSGHLLMAMLGADSVTGTNPYTHAITLLNTALPPSYTFVKFDNLAATAEQVTGVQLSQVDIKFATGNKNALLVAAKGTGKIQGSITKPSNTYSSASIFLPWQATLTLAGSGNTKLIDLQMSLKRPVEWIFGVNNTQDGTDRVVGPLEVSGKMTFASSDMTEINYYLNNTQPSASILFTSGTNTLTLQMTKCAFEDPTEIDHGSQYAKVMATFRAVANSTDAGTGNSPLKASIVNARSAAY